MKNQVLRTLLPFLLTALLTACGGGGGDDGEPPPPAPPTNLPPTVSIMPNPPAEGGALVTLQGTAIDSDGTVEIYAWTQVGGTPTVDLSSADTDEATFTAPMGEATVLTFRLTVTDDDGAMASAEATVTVTAANQPPTVNVAASPNPADGGNPVTLTGVAADGDGMVATYAWEQVSGTPAVELSGADTPRATFTAPMGPASDLTFRLTVTDDDGAMASAEVTVTVNRSNLPPELTVEADPNPASGDDVVTLTGMASDDGTVVSFAWVQIDTGMGEPMVDLSGADTDEATFTAPTGPPWDLTFRLTVTDNENTTASAEVTVAVNRGNQIPNVEAHVSVSVRGVPVVQNHADAGDFISLVGSASDPEDGSVASFLWEQVGGTPEVELLGADTRMATFTAPVTDATKLTFRLTVKDSEDAEASVEVMVRIAWYLEVSAGGSHTCGVRETGAVSCWGANNYGQSIPPEVRFDTVSAGDRHTCGVRSDDGTVECWGDNRDGQSNLPTDLSDVSFVTVSAGGSHTCGVRESYAVACWGNQGNGRSTPPSDMFMSVSAGWSHTCGVTTGGAVKCWGDRQLPAVRDTPSSMNFTSVSAGVSHSCGVLDTNADTNAVECWGEDSRGQAAPQTGPFVSVSAGESHTCGVRDTGAVQCWGSDVERQFVPSGVTLESVSAGSFHTCGVSDTGAVECWGDDDSGQSRRPVGAFMVVDAATEHTCGVLDTGDGVCWGMDFDSSTVPPLGLFETVSAGHRHTCWLTEEGTGVCRGEGMSRTTPPMGGMFDSVSAGQFHTCWVADGGFVACFDDNATVTSPGGTFDSVSAGDLHACGVRDNDGTVNAGVTTALCRP